MKYEFKSITYRYKSYPPVVEDMQSEFVNGWELIQVLRWKSSHSDTNYTAYFKREIQGE